MSKWKIGSLACVMLLSANLAWSQGGAKIASEQLVYNFGTIAESDGMASHVFKVAAVTAAANTSPYQILLIPIKGFNAISFHI